MPNRIFNSINWISVKCGHHWFFLFVFFSRMPEHHSLSLVILCEPISHSSTIHYTYIGFYSDCRTDKIGTSSITQYCSQLLLAHTQHTHTHNIDNLSILINRIHWLFCMCSQINCVFISTACDNFFFWRSCSPLLYYVRVRNVAVGCVHVCVCVYSGVLFMRSAPMKTSLMPTKYKLPGGQFCFIWMWMYAHFGQIKWCRQDEQINL